MTTTVVPTTSGRPGQLTFFISTQTSRKKPRVAGHHSRIGIISFPCSRETEDGRRETIGSRYFYLSSFRSLLPPRLPSHVFRLTASVLQMAGVEGFEPP